MIAALLALQLAAAAPPALVVRTTNRTVDVPIVRGAHGPLLRPEALAPMLPVTVRQITPVTYGVSIAGLEMQMEPGLPFVRIGSELHQLAAAPMIYGQQLLVPLQVLAEIVGARGTNVRWDAGARQLVVFAGSRQSRPGAQTATVEQAARAPASAVTPVRRPPRRARRLVVVDAGHGGPDKGMTGPIGGSPKIHEKDVTLAVSRRLGGELRGRGVDVVFTRTTDTLIALSDRGRIANRNQGDLFISVHVNAASPFWRDPGAARGFETYFLAEARTEDARRVEQMENEVVRFENGPNPSRDDPLSFIISDMVQNEHLRESSELAEIVQRRLARIHPGPNRGVKQAGFRVLVTAYMPAVLVEIGFGTNAAEAAYLATPQRQGEIARAIADAAMEYLERYERRVGGGGSWR